MCGLNLINIQGLTKPKLAELEEMFSEQCDILCITETHQKLDKLETDKSLIRIESMRKANDKKGGGLMILYKRNSGINLSKKPSKNEDILEVEGTIAHQPVRLILLYMSVENKPEDRNRNLLLKQEIEAKLDEKEDIATMLLGDFNGHVGFLGSQKEDKNGKFVSDLMSKNKMILLNCDEICSGLYTWGKREQKSVIDYVLVNSKMYQQVSKMIIDENQELLDLSDHNMITVLIKCSGTPSYRKAVWEEQTYFKTDQESMERFTRELQNKIETEHIQNIEDFNKIMKNVAEEKLKGKYRRKVIDGEERLQEKPWMTEEIREGIKQRKAANRLRRNSKTREEAEKWHEAYSKKKYQACQLIKEEMLKHEEKVTDQIRKSSCRSRALWENINKLKNTPREKIQTLHLFSENGIMLQGDEEKESLVSFWEEIYQKHENKICETWDDNTRAKYIESMEAEQQHIEVQGITYPPVLREHMDMALNAKKKIKNMKEIKIEEADVVQCIRKLRPKSSAGPDELKPEFYKALANSKTCLEKLTLCYQEELKRNDKPTEWKISRTRMIPKTTKPSAKDLRPIALTNVSYKIYMSLMKQHLEEHLERTEQMLETQAGFTKGGRIEDNLFLLQYCVEESRRAKVPLIVTSIDYSKAFDSIDRACMIQVLMKYRVHPKMIDAVAAIYQGDRTVVELNESTKAEIMVTSGIRQGCTGSTAFFKLMTYIISKVIETTDAGFKNDKFTLPILFFADDGLLLNHTIQETRNSVNKLIGISKECGLEINKKKSHIIIFNMKEQPSSIEDVEVKSSIKYLGIEVENSRNIFKRQKKIMIEKAQKMGNMTYSVIKKSCNKLLIGKTYWKSLALPSILYGTNIMPITEGEINKLQVIENGVFRQMLGAPKYAPNAALRGEVGASLMSTRVITGRLQYVRSILQGKNQLLKEVVIEMTENDQNKWMKTTMTYMREAGLKMQDLYKIGKEALKTRMKNQDTEKWIKEIRSKTTLTLYASRKNHVEEAGFMDNHPSSTIFFRARANCLPLNDRRRHTGEDTKCLLCSSEVENLEHMILNCPAYNEERVASILLQQPYQEHQADVLGSFLFEKEELEQKKCVLYQMWRKRCSEVKKIQPTNP